MITAPDWYDDTTGEVLCDEWMSALAYDYRSAPVEAWSQNPSRRDRHALSDNECALVLTNGAALAGFARAQASAGQGDHWGAFAAFIEGVIEAFAEALADLETPEAETATAAPQRAPGRRGRPRKAPAAA